MLQTYRIPVRPGELVLGVSRRRWHRWADRGRRRGLGAGAVPPALAMFKEVSFRFGIHYLRSEAAYTI